VLSESGGERIDERRADDVERGLGHEPEVDQQ
jgi:hypothetical protein